MKVYLQKFENKTEETPKYLTLIHRTPDFKKIFKYSFMVTGTPLSVKEGGEWEYAHTKKVLLIDEQFQKNFEEMLRRSDTDSVTLRRDCALDLRFIEDFSDITNWCVFVGAEFINLEKEKVYTPSVFSGETESSAFSKRTFENILSRTFRTKNQYYDITERGRNNVVIFLPLKNSTFEGDGNSILFVMGKNGRRIGFQNFSENEIEVIDTSDDVVRNLYKKYGIDIDADPSKPIDDFKGPSYFSLFVRDIIENNIPSVKITCEDNCTQEGMDVFVECSYRDEPLSFDELIPITDKGYISHQRVYLDENGRGKYKFIPLGLSVGEVVTLKAGFRLFSGIDRKEITVV